MNDKNLISGICLIAGGGCLTLAALITVASLPSGLPGGMTFGYILMLLGAGGITAGGVFHMLKK